MTSEVVKDRRASIQLLAEKMADMPQVECSVEHRFTDGLYMRQITMPEGSIVIGKIHATQHFNILLSGECIVHTIEGQVHHKAPDVWVSESGIQKCVVNITETVWCTTHVTNETDLDKIESAVIVESYDQLEIDSIIERIEGDKRFEG